MKLNRIVAASLLVGLSIPSFAQDQPENIYDMSLEDLMNISVVSASNEEEKLFDAPVSIYALSREEISRAGVTSIPEALRLIPGVIVRETTNGNYDIHLRGYDNPSKYTYGVSQSNTLTLVMIDNRPVFNYNMGGTFWESLPVAIADIERIELVEGPSAPLFGPNAVTGVVNIITRSFDSKETQVSARLTGAAPGNSLIGNLAIGKAFDKVSVGITANTQQRQRTDDQYYLFGGPDGSGGMSPSRFVGSEVYSETYQFVEEEDINLKNSLSSTGVNGYANYKPTSDLTFDLSLGYQENETQRMFWQAEAPLTLTQSNSQYANLISEYKGLKSRISYTQGSDDLHRASTGYDAGYDYRVLESTLEYSASIKNIVKLKPMIGHHTSRYSDEQHGDGKGVLGSDATIDLSFASLRADITPIEELRIIASARVDKFELRPDAQLSYQGAITYTPTNKLLLRGVYGTSYSGLYYSQAFISLNAMTSSGMAMYRPNPYVEPTNNTMMELGIRYSVLSNLQLDLALFSQKLENINDFAIVKQSPLTLTQTTLPLEVEQLGVTISANYVPTSKIQLRPFITMQKSQLRNFDYYLTHPLAYNGQDEDLDSTPTIFGGFSANYTVNEKVNINLMGYYLGKQTLYNQENYVPGVGIMPTDLQQLNGKLLLNPKVSYRLHDKFKLEGTIRNLLGDESREHYATDRTARQYLLGINYNF